MVSKLMHESKKAFELDTKRFNIVAIGRLVSVKGYENLLKSIAILVKQKHFHHIQLRIIGTGELFELLSKLINELGLQNNIELCGFVENPYPVILNSDLFVMTSFSEGLPTALCEAMILGKPVMVTNVSGCSEVVGDGKYGAICEPYVDSIALKLEQIIQDDDYRSELAKNSIERSKIFSDEQTMKKYYNLFESDLKETN